MRGLLFTLLLIPMLAVADKATDLAWIKLTTMTSVADESTGQNHLTTHNLSPKAAEAVAKVVAEGQAALQEHAKKLHARRCLNPSIFASEEAFLADRVANLQAEEALKQRYVAKAYDVLASGEKGQLQMAMTHKPDGKILETRPASFTVDDLNALHVRACKLAGESQ